jgi:hypothetical protein
MRPPLGLGNRLQSQYCHVHNRHSIWCGASAGPPRGEARGTQQYIRARVPHPSLG